MAITRLSSNTLDVVFEEPASVTSTTGSPTTGNYTASGATWDYWQWDADGSVTIGTPGWAKVLVVGGGARGDGVNRGDGGNVVESWQYLNAGTITVDIGAGGAGGNTVGGPSWFGTYVGVSGGRNTTGGLGALTNYGTSGATGVSSSLNGTATTYGGSPNSATLRGEGGQASAVAGRVILAIRRK